jgi:hypothetical protein
VAAAAFAISSEPSAPAKHDDVEAGRGQGDVARHSDLDGSLGRVLRMPTREG